MFGKVLTVLLRVIIIFFGLPLVAHFYKYTLPDLMRDNSLIGTVLLFASVLGPMFLDSLIDRESEQNQLSTNERGN